MSLLLAKRNPARLVLNWTLAGALVGLMPDGVWGKPSEMLIGSASGAVLALVLYVSLSSISGFASGWLRGLWRWPSLRPAVVVESVFEELVWRGLAFQVLREYVPTAAALAFSTMGFALVHFESQGVKGMFVHVVTGLSFASVVLVTGSLAAAVVAHVVYNLFAASGRSDRIVTARP
jgi:membrane protease YdiL (CAAX protease family)